MSFGKRLRAAREEADLSQQDIANLFDPPLTRNAVANWEADVTFPETPRLPAIARAVKRSIDHLLAGRVQQSTGQYNVSPGPEVTGKVPLISWVQAGVWSSAVDNFHPGRAEDWAETTVPVHQHTYALRVRGDSMTNPSGLEPTFPDGCVIIVEPNAISSLEQMLDKFVIVKRTAEDAATFKQLVRDAGKYYLKPLNPRYPMLELNEDDVFCGVIREKPVRYF